MNTILSAIAAEEDYTAAIDSVGFYASSLPSKIRDNNAFLQFIERQTDMLRYANDRYQLIKSNVNTETDTDRLTSSDVTKKLISDFKYMQEHGILDKIRKQIIDSQGKLKKLM